MRRWLRSRFADRLLTYHERQEAERHEFRVPVIRPWLLQEIWQPLLRDLLGGYPPGHRYYQANPIIRYYAGVMVILTLASLIMGC